MKTTELRPRRKRKQQRHGYSMNCKCYSCRWTLWWLSQPKYKQEIFRNLS